MAQTICAHCYRYLRRRGHRIEGFLCTACETAWLAHMRARTPHVHRPVDANAVAATASHASITRAESLLVDA